MVKKKKPKPRGYWTIKRIKDSAKKFKFVKDWYENEFLKLWPDQAP